MSESTFNPSAGVVTWSDEQVDACEAAMAAYEAETGRSAGYDLKYGFMRYALEVSAGDYYLVRIYYSETANTVWASAWNAKYHEYNNAALTGGALVKTYRVMKESYAVYGASGDTEIVVGTPEESDATSWYAALVVLVFFGFVALLVWLRTRKG